jgi:exopolyphosphatase/guanosine-5'-triphosphate,3'-diphosphate pyrophosphatase
MILAGIDIGTNTPRLLIAEMRTGCSLRDLYSDRKITRLGQDLDRTGRLSPAASERSVGALLDFTKHIRRHAVAHVAAVGTSALRNASNSSEFISDVQKRTGLAISVITGNEEARLTLLGVAQALKGPVFGTSPLASALVVDIGGGSTEIMVTRPDHAPFMASLSLGAVYLTERLVKHDPPTKNEIEFLRFTIRQALEGTGPEMRPDPSAILVGTAGTITTLAAMDQGLAEYDPEKINGYVMTGDAIDRVVGKLIASTLKERSAMPGVEKGREDIILAGAILTQEIMNRFGFSRMVVSDWGLREGIILDLHERIASGSESSAPPYCP